MKTVDGSGAIEAIARISACGKPWSGSYRQLNSRKAQIYEEAAYNLSIDDRQLPPPTLSQVVRQWLDGLLTPSRGLG